MALENWRPVNACSIAWNLGGETTIGGKKQQLCRREMLMGEGVPRELRRKCVREQLQKQAVGRWQMLWDWALEKRNEEKGKNAMTGGEMKQGLPVKELHRDRSTWSWCYPCASVTVGSDSVRKTWAKPLELLGRPLQAHHSWWECCVHHRITQPRSRIPPCGRCVCSPVGCSFGGQWSNRASNPQWLDPLKSRAAFPRHVSPHSDNRKSIKLRQP